MFVGEDTGSDEAEKAVLDSSSGDGSASSRGSHVIVDSPGHTLQYTTSAISAVKGGEKK
jgi:hypothetical protein